MGNIITNILRSFYYSFRGLIYILRSERNARIHLLVAGLVLVAGLLLGLSNIALAAVFFAIVMVFLAEIINTAFEKTLDLIETDHNPQIKLIKDMAAGAVLVAAMAAAAIGIVIFYPYIVRLLWPR